jgi:hypothetical protein
MGGLRLLDLIFCQLLGWLVLLARRSATNDAELVGARCSATSGGLRALMDQPTEPISPRDPASRHEARRFAGSERWRLPKARCGRWPS